MENYRRQGLQEGRLQTSPDEAIQDYWVWEFEGDDGRVEMLRHVQVLVDEGRIVHALRSLFPVISPDGARTERFRIVVNVEDDIGTK